MEQETLLTFKDKLELVISEIEKMEQDYQTGFMLKVLKRTLIKENHDIQEHR